MQTSSEGRDFAAYNAAQATRPVRPLACRAVEAELAGDDGSSRRAVELGSGVGIEARFLAERGYEVRTYDSDPSVERAMARVSAAHPVSHTTTDLEQIDRLPDADLILACASLSFVRREAFDRLWRVITRALRPGAVLAVDLFGDQDDWAGTDGTYLRRAEVDGLLQELEVLSLAEQEREGGSYSGPKHWHTYQVIARCT